MPRNPKLTAANEAFALICSGLDSEFTASREEGREVILTPTIASANASFEAVTLAIEEELASAQEIIRAAVTASRTVNSDERRRAHAYVETLSAVHVERFGNGLD